MRKDIYFRRLKSVHIQNSVAYIFPIGYSSFISSRNFKEKRLPLLEVPWLFDASVLENNVAVLLELL